MASADDGCGAPLNWAGWIKQRLPRQHPTGPTLPAPVPLLPLFCLFIYHFLFVFFFFCFKFSVLLSWLKEAFSFARPAAISAKSDMTTWCRFPSFTAGLKAKLCRPSSRPPIGSNPFIYSSIGAGSDWNCTLCLLLPFQFFFLFFFFTLASNSPPNRRNFQRRNLTGRNGRRNLKNKRICIRGRSRLLNRLPLDCMDVWMRHWELWFEPDETSRNEAAGVGCRWHGLLV